MICVEGPLREDDSMRRSRIVGRIWVERTAVSTSIWASLGWEKRRGTWKLPTWELW